MTLIPSDRHTRSDLELWVEMEEADLVHADRIGTKVDRAMAAIESFGTDCYCGVSWGKDSVVVAHMTSLLGIPLVNLRVAPSRNPHCDDVRDAFLSAHDCEYHEEPVDYSGVDRFMAPRDVDRATDREWNAAIRVVRDRFGERHVLGIRARESSGRLARCARWGESSPNGCAPLAWWTAQDVFAYLACNNLPVHPNYAMLGGGRWDRDRIRTAEIGDVHGTGAGRREWEIEYYRDELARIERR